jgi:RND family efflux transporter MFP subunit
MSTTRRRAALIATVLTTALFINACHRSQDMESGPGAGTQPPVPVDVANPLVMEIVEWDEFTGRFEADKYVELRARVSGYLDAIHFRDGQIVEKGDLLFTIDPRPFEAQSSRAEAEARRVQTQLGNIVLELRRGERLLESNAISQEAVEERQSAKAAAEAQLEAARASIRSAELDLEFTRISSPIRGRISDRKVDVGNLISGGSSESTLLATIVSLDPIHFVFDASEADYLRYGRLGLAGKRPSSREVANPVEIRLMDEDGWLHKGRMDFVDNVLDPRTGTMRARAVLDNPDSFLTPGVFGRVRVPGSGRYEAVLIPDSAILYDQSNKIVYKVDDAGTVSAQRIVTGPMSHGLRVVREGLSREDRIIVNGLQRARPTGMVTPNPVGIHADGDNAAAGR